MATGHVNILNFLTQEGKRFGKSVPECRYDALHSGICFNLNPSSSKLYNFLDCIKLGLSIFGGTSFKNFSQGKREEM